MVYNTNTQTNNIVKGTDFQEAAKEAMFTISEALSRSVGYYGSTTIIENAVTGHKITKDGYTILQSLKFSAEKPIANTILNFIKNISKTLVTEVGDGSTSSVLTSDALFNFIADIEKEDKISPKALLDELEVSRKLIEDELLKAATPITDENMEVLKYIASVSNNNDEKSGDIVYQAFKEVGVDGFVNLADSYKEEDFFEVSRGMELPRGYFDEAYADRGSMTINFKNPNFLVFKGVLDNSDEEWFTGFMGYYFQATRNPLVVIADGFEKSFNDLVKINKRNNERQGIPIDIALISANSTKEEETEDLAIYLDATLLDKTDDDSEFSNFKFSFLGNDVAGITKYIDFEGGKKPVPFGRAKQALIELNDSKFIEGAVKPEALEKRLEELTMQEEYYTDLNSKTDVNFQIFKLRKRKSNLQAKVATIYVSGTSEVERETRKYLFEDAVYATKSAMVHGYVSGGNLAVSKAIKRITEKDTGELSDFQLKLLAYLDQAFRSTYSYVLHNYKGFTSGEIEKLIEDCVATDSIYNLKTLEMEKDSETHIINSVRTDNLIMNTAFSIIGLLVSSNQYIGKIQ